MSIKSVKILSLLFLFYLGITAAQQEIPSVIHRMNDGTGTLSQDEIRTIEHSLAEFEQATSNQIVVLMIPSLDGKDPKDYAYSFAEKNKIGKKDRNNGVLLLIAKEDREIDIEVGYGLEGALTDAISSQIIRKTIGPRFREGDFFRGISDGVEAIMAATKGEYKGDGVRNSVKNFSPIIIVLLIIFFGVFPRIFGGRRSSIGSRGLSSGFPWWWGGFGGGGGFSGGSFGGGGGFSGFSGGGGSFGGGGASGSW